MDIMSVRGKAVCGVIGIRPMREEDRDEVLAMMRVFYDSPAVITKASDTVLRRDIDDCLSDMPLIEGFVFDDGGILAGYAMCAMCYTTEFGGLCVWVEDLYLKPAWRHQGLGTRFFAFIEARYPQAVRFKLEAERENAPAVAAYRKCGYEISDYIVMTRETDGK